MRKKSRQNNNNKKKMKKNKMMITLRTLQEKMNLILILKTVILTKKVRKGEVMREKPGQKRLKNHRIYNLVQAKKSLKKEI